MLLSPAAPSLALLLVSAVAAAAAADGAAGGGAVAGAAEPASVAADTAAAPPVRIMPFGDSITVFDCRLNAYTSANDLPVFQPLDSLPAFSCVAVCLPTSAALTLLLAAVRVTSC